MARGQPDFGLYTPTGVASGIADPGEAAARLGSINVYDRRGWTVWMDDFEAPVLKWTASVAGAGVLPVLQSDLSFSGTQCPYLYTPGGLAASSIINRRFPLVRRGTVGAEIWVCGSTVTPGFIYLTLRVSDSRSSTQGRWLIDTVNHTIYIQSGGAEIPIATNVYATAERHNFLPVKLVIDTDTDKYVRLIVGPDEYDISAYALQLIGGPGFHFIEAYIGVEGDASAIMYAYADNFILTQNEP